MIPPVFNKVQGFKTPFEPLRACFSLGLGGQLRWMVISAKRTIYPAVILAACCLAPGQTAQPRILTIDLENFVEYRADTSDVSLYGTNAAVTPPAAILSSRDFYVATGLGDIVAVNGQPAKGLYAMRSRAIVTDPNPSTGGAIGDVTRAAIREEAFEILSASGNPVGTIIGLGLSGGAPPPGAPAAQTGVNFAVIGGTGAFVGVRGISGSGGGQARGASITEDPRNRRINSGGKSRRVLTLYLMSAPEIVLTPSGPAMTHSSDFSLVTVSKPAAAGEILSAFVTGLGPVRPGVDPGQPFPSSPLAAVNSPVDVTVNGKPGEVLAAVGLPGTVNGYQVNFRLPPDTAKGTTTIQLSAAWIAATPALIEVR